MSVNSILVSLIVALSVVAAARTEKPGTLEEQPNWSDLFIDAMVEKDCDRALKVLRDAGRVGDQSAWLTLRATSQQALAHR